MIQLLLQVPRCVGLKFMIALDKIFHIKGHFWHKFCTQSKKMLSLVIVLLAVSCGALARIEPGPNDPDTYPYKYIKWEVSPGVVITESLDEQPEDFAVTPSKIKISYFSKNHPDHGQVIDMNDPATSLKTTDFQKGKPTTFVIHGWKNNGQSPVCVLTKDAIVYQKPDNVFVVDWSEYSMKNYVSARWAVADVGKVVGDFIRAIVVGNGLQLHTTRIVGHSLGAHVSGFAGKTLDSKVDTIIGLDPAWPLFYFSKKAKRLDSSDAKFVEVVHTNGWLLGFPYSLGHSDFYPNGGKSQAGCFLDMTGQCAHARAYLYYEESLKSGNFVSQKCDTYSNWKNGKCSANPKCQMGEYYTDKRSFGDYFLDTNTAAPFAKGG